MTTAAVAAASLVERDRRLVWHPYAALDGPAPYAVLAADGVRLQLEDAAGMRFEAIDAMSSWWCAIHGYRHPVLDAALHEQASRFSHVMFGGLTHEPGVALAEQLVELAPGPLQHVFFADSGSVAIEVALKMALQYQAAMGRPKRRRFVALHGGYHGDTTGAMSICDPVDGMHSLFGGLVAGQLFLPRPPATGAATEVQIEAWRRGAEALLEEHQDRVAAIVFEPVLQGAGGMHVYPAECVAQLRQLADRYGLLLIADEVATGFGRTGTMFACEQAGVAPDVMCVGKALTGGYLTLAAVLCSGAVADAITRSPQQALLHGPTFMANPLACAVASASLSLLDAPRLQRVNAIATELTAALAPAAELASVRDVRVLGGVGVVQLREPVDVVAVTQAALARGVWVRPFRDLVYTMPPYVCDPAEVAQIGAAILAAVAEVHGR
ncbi:MAG TPA: adenosylmethionine--8-amino-7-oxononanoate transaminase [Solirubrobacteraceae bacterium]|nr:adenosylmethionine--8-amino-7-oxononanoate transaminase [Solirubrobacteraceae bacterium]